MEVAHDTFEEKAQALEVMWLQKFVGKKFSLIGLM
jgi:hypothetical protein